MLPAPTTIATSTPCSCTSATCRATAATRSGSVPNSSVPISASPESFSRIRLNAGAAAAIDARAYSVALEDQEVVGQVEQGRRKRGVLAEAGMLAETVMRATASVDRLR